ncbi:uncharacterized protein LOC130824479 [Amaranthus tricolor]|uniref:uncharacterized protein LOC130824479 n=1 Tax=Amaranthus tricolor TaxID=29722 RepID=UPI00258C7CC8|nr:uncharacterized protein LOC130824479 [Amaranthus tricolor]
MMMGSLQKSFLTNPLAVQTPKPIPKTPNLFFIVSCKYPPNDHQKQNDSSRKLDKQLAKLAIVTLAAGVLSLGSVGDASAAKSGGRIGGQAFRSSAPRPSAPRASSPRLNSRTNIYVNPPVAPPLIGGYGYGFGSPFYGGWGWSPFSFFAPGPSVAVGVGGGFDLIVWFMIFGAVSTIARRFFSPRDDDDDDDDF